MCIFIKCEYGKSYFQVHACHANSIYIKIVIDNIEYTCYFDMYLSIYSNLVYQKRNSRDKLTWLYNNGNRKCSLLLRIRF